MAAFGPVWDNFEFEYWLLLQNIAIKSTCMYKNTTECLQILMWWYLFQSEQWGGPIGEDAGVGATAGTGPVWENENHCWSGEASVLFKLSWAPFCQVMLRFYREGEAKLLSKFWQWKIFGRFLKLKNVQILDRSIIWILFTICKDLIKITLINEYHCKHFLGNNLGHI